MNYSWLGFGVAGSAEQTVVHLFANSKSSRAKYELKAKLSIFGDSIEPSEIMIDGLMLGSPDGIRLSDAFPALNKITAKSYFGVEIVFISDQKQIDISNSEIVVELVSKDHHVSYRPAADKLNKDATTSGLAFEDYKQSSSILLVNRSDKQLSCTFESLLENNKYQNFIMKPKSVEENNLSSNDGAWQSQVCSWGDLNLHAFCAKDLSSDLVAYSLSFDRKKQDIVSIQAL